MIFLFGKILSNLLKKYGFISACAVLSLGEVSASSWEEAGSIILCDDGEESFGVSLPKVIVSGFDDDGSGPSQRTMRAKRPVLSAHHDIQDKRQCTRMDENTTETSQLLQTPPRPVSLRTQFTPTTTQNLRTKGISPRKLIAATNQILLSPSKRDASAPESFAIRGHKVRELVTSFQVVPFPTLMASANSLLTRERVPTTLIISGQEIPIVDLHPSVEHPEESFETPKETLERRARQRALLAKVRQDRASSVVSSSQNERPFHELEQNVMVDFVNYLSVRRGQLESLGRMRRSEVEDIFQAVFAPVYKVFFSEGYTVWYNPSFINLDVEIEGRTNYERMESGLSPIGSDGCSMNLHHVTHYDALTHKTTSHLVLIHATTHLETYHNELHFEGHEFYLPRTPVERRLFDPMRAYLLQEMLKHLSPQDSDVNTPLEFPLGVVDGIDLIK